MIKPTIKIRVQNGLSFETFKREVFEVNHVVDDFYFEESENPDFIIFGPYGNDIPTAGNYIRIGYFCENITPDFSICDWAFGIPSEVEINNPKYKKIQWHDVHPSSLLKRENLDVEQIFNGKKHFCNFVYSNPVPYREKFFKQLSKYKKVDAPGKSMQNMPWPNNNNAGSKWGVKRQFLSSYKFTIAFENYVYPGYQTEKLYDAMLAESLPIYCGDPNVGEIFNTSSFLNATEYVSPNNGKLSNWLEQNSQSDFIDIRPQYFKNPYHRIKRKLKAIGRNTKMNLQFNNLDFSALIDQIISIDQDDKLYLKYLTQPWLKENTVPELTLSRAQWHKIFSETNE